MPYQPLAIPPEISEPVRHAICQGLERPLREARWLMSHRSSNLHVFGFATALILTTSLAAASKLLIPRRMKDGERFKKAIVDYYPWNLDPAPLGREENDIAELIYADLRNPLVHAGGISSQTKLSLRLKLTLKSDRGLQELELNQSTKPIRPLLSESIDEGVTVFSVDTFYWAIRRIIESMASDAAQHHGLEDWILGGKFDAK